MFVICRNTLQANMKIKIIYQCLYSLLPRSYLKEMNRFTMFNLFLLKVGNFLDHFILGSLDIHFFNYFLSLNYLIIISLFSSIFISHRSQGTTFSNSSLYFVEYTLLYRLRHRIWLTYAMVFTGIFQKFLLLKFSHFRVQFNLQGTIKIIEFQNSPYIFAATTEKSISTKHLSFDSN